MTGLFDRQIHPHIACRMNDVRTLRGQRAVGCIVQAEMRERYIPAPGLDTFARWRVCGSNPPEPAEFLVALGQVLRRFCAQQKLHSCFRISQQERDQGAADGTGGAGHEVVFHRLQITLRPSLVDSAKVAPEALSRRV